MNWKFLLSDKEMSRFSHLGFSVPAFSGRPGNMNKCSSACLFRKILMILAVAVEVLLMSFFWVRYPEHFFTMPNFIVNLIVDYGAGCCESVADYEFVVVFVFFIYIYFDLFVSSFGDNALYQRQVIRASGNGNHLFSLTDPPAGSPPP
ncbi:hypothetical protein GE253_00640 [Niveispirillum sp. SYP-B3756]|uniref:hypothetical protein n=1 Tax=Niveispirillum sp. SYP-B3756 TaxID=2662178 RepID=UPI0012921297|nr:hypothetical protein [Niveispirillum sp. SYP-B3756]MQP63842.1 hypothetical protein [Niveispirillum sp. SYP-B3756]